MVQVPDDVLRETLQMLSDVYTEHLPERLREVEETWEKVRTNPNDATMLHQLFALIHKLAGSGGTFGYHALSATATLLKEFLRPLVSNTLAPTPEDCAFIGQTLHQIRLDAAPGKRDLDSLFQGSEG